MSKKKPRVLYLSYDGMTDPLGQSQVLSYQGQLAQRGFECHILSFEKPELYNKKGREIQELTDQLGIKWYPLMYHKKPPVISTLKDIKAGWRKIKALYKDGHFDIVHCRGYITPILGRRCKKTFGSKFIFDMRGWWADEKLESGLWAASYYRPVYRYFKGLEKKFFTESDAPISLTIAGAIEAEKLGYRRQEEVVVIPTCVNFDVFQPFSAEIRSRIRSKLNIPEEATVLLYSGSLGGNYGTEILFDMFKRLRSLQPNAILFVLSRTDRAYILETARQEGVAEEYIRIAAANYNEVGGYLMAGDIGVIVYKNTYSTIGRSPTKLGEYWASGLPAISISGIGDLDNLKKKYPEGLELAADSSGNAMQQALKALLEQPRDKEQLLKYAKDYYDLQKGVDAYEQIYRNLL